MTAAPVSPAPPSRRRGHARFTTGTLCCDGRLDKPFWDGAEIISQFTDPWKPEPGPISIEARVLWNTQCLLVRFCSRNAELVASRTQRQSDVCNDSCVEMFISPFFTAPERYFTFEINALGTMLNRRMDLTADPVKRDPWFPAGMRIGHSITGTRIDDPAPREWVIELAVPWSQFSIGAEVYRPKAGDLWRVNFMRCGGKRLNPFLMWNPAASPKPAYHQPQYFGELEFSA